MCCVLYVNKGNEGKQISCIPYQPHNHIVNSTLVGVSATRVLFLLSVKDVKVRKTTDKEI